MKNYQLPSIGTFTGILDLGLTNIIDLFVYKLLTLPRKFNQQIKFNVPQTQKRINQLCEEYELCERTVKRVLQRIAKAGLIIVVYDLSFGEYVVEVKSLNELFGQKGRRQTDVSDVVVDENVDSEGDTEEKHPTRGIDQQQLIYADQKCRSVGINYQKKDLWKIAKYPKEIINLAINCFKSSEQAESTFIRNPAGWLISCLEKKYYLSHRPEKFAKSAEQKLFELQDWFLDNFGTIPSRQLALDFSYKKTGLPA